MKNSKDNYCNMAFSRTKGSHAKTSHAMLSHIYIEEVVWEHPRTQSILKHFPEAEQIPIHHYKDVFCRRKQDVALQNQFPQLILAAKQGNLVYEGAAVCQNFGSEHFYYCSCVMNCLYHCEYCYLKGMYPSGNIVIFVNLEDIFAEVEKLLAKHPVYLCVSYDTDLMALEGICGFVQAWLEFVKRQDNLRIEIRTKCGMSDFWDKVAPNQRAIFAFTLSPQRAIQAYEHRTAALPARIACAKKALEKGFSVRLCFDPMLYYPNWQKEYLQMLEQISEQIPMKELYDVSVGSFRISQDYLKKLRKVMKYSAVVQYPFENRDGVYQYPPALVQDMERLVVDFLREYLPEEKIFCWES